MDVVDAVVDVDCDGPELLFGEFEFPHAANPTALMVTKAKAARRPTELTRRSAEVAVPKLRGCGGETTYRALSTSWSRSPDPAGGAAQ